MKYLLAAKIGVNSPYWLLKSTPFCIRSLTISVCPFTAAREEKTKPCTRTECENKSCLLNKLGKKILLAVLRAKFYSRHQKLLFDKKKIYLLIYIAESFFG